MSEFEVRLVQDLQPHPEVERIFEPLSPAEQQQVFRNMAGGGRFAPLVVNPENRILAGVENWEAARELGWRRISVVPAPAMNRFETAALIVAENIAHREIRELHTSRAMNNFFDMAPLRPPDGW